jgi:hypothetical protein
VTAQKSEVFPYASAQAFGAALTHRLGGLAGSSGPSLSQLRRQFAYDRLLARLFTTGPQDWILKGGVSMIARLTSARHTADVDLVACADSAAAAFDALHAAAMEDLGDFFTFRFESPRALVQGVPGLRIPAEARLGPRIFERFGVDLVTGVVITGRPEEAEPLLQLSIAGLVRPRYRLYPLVDSIADKVMAIVETHQGRTSTRFRDLVDLVLIAHSQQVRADELAAAFLSERLRRGLPDFDELEIPDEEMWRTGYQAVARDVSSAAEKTLTNALPLVKSFVDPVLAGTAADSEWDPAALVWGRPAILR